METFRDTPLLAALVSCCEDAAGSLAATARNDEAIGLYTEAATLHAAAGANGDLERVEGSLRRLGARSRKTRRACPAFGWDSLTPAELAVSELVASGLTNPEIGARLFVSRRTVETHLSHIFRKLDYVGRAQLASEYTRRTAS